MRKIKLLGAGNTSIMQYQYYFEEQRWQKYTNLSKKYYKCLCSQVKVLSTYSKMYLKYKL